MSSSDNKLVLNIQNEILDLVYKVSALALKSSGGKTEFTKEEFSKLLASEDAKSFLSSNTLQSPMLSAAKAPKAPRTTGAKGSCCFKLKRGENVGQECGKSANHEHEGKMYCKTHHASVSGNKPEKKEKKTEEKKEKKEKKDKNEKKTSSDEKKIDASKMKAVLGKKPVTYDVSNPPFEGAKFEKTQGFVLDGTTVRGLADGKVDGNKVAISNYSEVLSESDKARVKKYGYKLPDEKPATDKSSEKSSEEVPSKPEKVKTKAPKEEVEEEEDDDGVPQIDDEEEGDD